jgi:putative oxidoreductase
MTLPFQARAYEKWAPVLGRVLLAVAFLVGAAFKIPGTEGFAMEVGMTAAVGVPFASVAVFLAFILEVVGGVALIVGWNTRLFAFVLGLFTALLTALFHMDFSNPMNIGMFLSHLSLMGGLLYLSVYGAQSVAAKTCPLPQGMSKS